MSPVAVPATDIAIGSRWTREGGAIEGGLPSEKLFAAATLDTEDWTRHSHLRGSVTARLGAMLGLSADAEVSAWQTMSLTDAEVVRVRNLSDLPDLSDGAHYVWQGVRVKGFSFDAASGREAEIRANLTRRTDGGSTPTLTASGSGASSRTFTVSGAELFVAQRIVKLELDPRLDTVIVAFTDGDRRTRANLRSEYTFKVDVRSGQPDGCDGTLTITSHGSNPAPDPITRRIWCRTAVENGEIPLPARYVGDGIATDQIVVQNLRLGRSGQAPDIQHWLTGSVTRERRTLHVRTVRP